MSAGTRPRVRGSYPPEDVTFLLTDLGDARIETSLGERERAMRSGGHYSERLPIEYRPGDEYMALFHAVLEQRARDVAVLVGVLAEELLGAAGDGLVIVSLARAGTPVGVLLRRYLDQRLGVRVPHYSVSIIRDRGLDLNAMRHILGLHPPEALRFVDGWTGKGVIGRELIAALSRLDWAGAGAIDRDLWVLADPAHSTPRFATRRDVLVPSACLNATVSGLVSRTVLNAALVGPDDFHGAKTYPELADEDVSMLFVERIQQEFATVSEAVAQVRRGLGGQDPADHRGRREVSDIQRRFGLDDENLVKPGVGETTRVLLRRLPWRVLVHPDAQADLDLVLLLARDRGVQVEPWPHMSYACCGLIDPNAGSVQ